MVHNCFPPYINGSCRTIHRANFRVLHLRDNMCKIYETKRGNGLTYRKCNKRPLHFFALVALHFSRCVVLRKK